MWLSGPYEQINIWQIRSIINFNPWDASNDYNKNNSNNFVLLLFFQNV